MNIVKENNQEYKAAIYIRLSKEDGDREESESVTNQRKILNTKFMMNMLMMDIRERISIDQISKE